MFRSISIAAFCTFSILTPSAFIDAAELQLTNDGKPTLKGVSASVVGTVTRADGTKQLTIKGWPVYHYIGDKTPGQWKGQNVSGKWFVIKPDGAKNLTCLPAISKPVAPPAATGSDSNSSDGTGSSGSDYSY